MSAKVMSLQLPQINSCKSATGEKRTAESFSTKSTTLLNADSIQGAPGSATAKWRKNTTRPLGCLPSVKRAKAWRELGLLTKENENVKYNLKQEVHGMSKSSHNTTTVAVPPTLDLHPKASPPVMNRISVLKTSIAETGHTDDEEYLDMIAKINMSHYKDDKGQMICEFKKQHPSSLQTSCKRQSLKSSRLQSSKPLHNGLALEYIRLAEQSQLSTRVHSSDIRNSTEHEPCHRCTLRGTRCTHCIAIRTGGGYIILDTNLPTNNGELERIVKNWKYKHRNTVGLNSDVFLHGKRTQNSTTDFSRKVQASYDGMPPQETAAGISMPHIAKPKVHGEEWSWEDQGQNFARSRNNATKIESLLLNDQMHNSKNLQTRHITNSKSRLTDHNKDEHGEYGQLSLNEKARQQKFDYASELTQPTLDVFDDSSHTKGASLKKQGFQNTQHTTSLEAGEKRPPSSRHGRNVTPDIIGTKEEAKRKERTMIGIQKQEKKAESLNKSEIESDHEKENKRNKSAKYMKSPEMGTDQSKKHHNSLLGIYEHEEKDKEEKERQLGDLMRFKSKRDNVKVKDCSLQELQGIHPLDYLAKYCIIDQKKVPHYQQVFDNVDRDEDNLITIPELDFALKSVNYNLISDSEMHYIHNILELAGRYALNFQLFSLVAALSEKVVALEDMVKRLINDMDFEALETKMKKCKELFYLLANDKEGLVTTRDLAVELQAGGLTKEHVDFVTDRLNYDGRGIVQFLDYLTYVPLFVEIHDNINDNPLDFTRNK